MRNGEVLRRCATIDDLRAIARRRLPRPIFDFIDGAAFRERTRDANIADLAAFRFRQRVLTDVARRSIATDILGQPAAMPVAIAPTGMSGAIPGGGRGEWLAARAAKAAGVPFTLGMLAMSAVEEIAAEIAPPWFQLCMLTDRTIVRGLVERAERAACPVLMLTVTWPLPSQMNRAVRTPYIRIPPVMTPEVVLAYGRKPRWAVATLLGRPIRLRNLDPYFGGRAMPAEVVGLLDAGTTWNDVAWLRDLWPRKLVIKGITEPEDVARAIALGVDGVSVSNHGGNQLDDAASTIAQLPAVVAAAAGRIAVLLDGGIRSGQDVLKALALGADACLLGRAHLYGLGAGGEAGVARALEIVRTELAITAALVGLNDVRDASPDILHGAPAGPNL